MKQLDKLIALIEQRIQPSGFKLSDFGKAEIAKRFKKKETDGGYTSYWHNL